MVVRVARLASAIIRRSLRLLDMDYKPSEIASELGASKDQIMRLVSAGAPGRKDSKGHYWIHGETFAKWLHDVAPKNYKTKIAIFGDDQAYCVVCKKQVTYTERRRKGNLVYGTCPEGHPTARFISLKPKKG